MTPAPRAIEDPGAALDLRSAARLAWLWGLPLVEIAQTRARGAILGPAATAAGGFSHNPNLAGPDQRGVTTPNNDTLYSTAFVDLAGGSAEVVLPAGGDRYVSLQILDAYTNTVATLGSRTTGRRGGRYVVAGPTGDAPRGAIRSPTPWVWMIARTLVDGPQDLMAARAIQQGFEVRAPQPRNARPPVARDAPWDAYFPALQELMAENPPPVTDNAFFEAIARLGLGPEEGFDRAAFTPEEAAEIAAGVATAQAMLGAPRTPRLLEGWSYPAANLGDYRQDYLTRAAVALAGLGALTCDEAMYMRAGAPEGGVVFQSRGLHRLSFPPGREPPVNAFWSLSLYEVTPVGQLFFTPNRLDRYAIGDRTPGLARSPEGSLDIWIGPEDPGGARAANWLPAPADKPYALILRAYLPKPELLNGGYRLPPIETA